MEGRKTTVRVGRATKKPNRILADDAYWNVPFLKRYLNRCDEIAVHEPLKAYAMAAPIVDLADTRISIRGRPGAYKSAVERRSYRVHARIVRAQAAKSVGECGEAEELYEAAFELAKKKIDTSVQARLHTRYAWLLFAQSNAEAVTHAQQAIELDSDKITLGAALIARGAVAHKFEEKGGGLEYLASALALTKAERTTKRGRRVFYAALHALAKDLSECQPWPEAQQRAYVLLGEVKSYLAGRPKSVAKMQVYWQMGRIACNLGYDKHGPRLMQKARQGFKDLGEPFEFALISLDLAGICLESLEFESYDELLADTYKFLESCGDARLLEALSFWSRGVRVSKAELVKTRRAIEELRGGGR